MTTLDDLGARICILGPSNSGKSTLAKAIGAARGMEPVHLDQLHHRPHSDWQPRPEAEFAALHDAAIAGERWVMDGNYARYVPRRLSRATGLILLDTPTATSLWRYVRRCLVERDRIGGLAGGKDTVKWLMIHHIVFVTPANRRRSADLFGSTHMPKIALSTSRDLAAFYGAERLDR